MLLSCPRPHDAARSEEPSLVARHARPPSAVGFMARALLPSPGIRPGGAVPGLVERWEGFHVEPRDLAALRRATGLHAGCGAVLHPHVFGFRLQMSLLTRRAFPLPIWGALQTRNHLAQLSPFDLGAPLDLETRVGPARVVEKGIEIDLSTRLLRAGEPVWKSEITYYYRGRFGAAGREAPRPPPDLSRAPVAGQFRAPAGGRLAFGRLTGDYNGIHGSDWYARRFGFPRAFLHPQRAAGACIARLAGPRSVTQALDLWIKGPVPYGASVVLRAREDDAGLAFALSVEGDPRAVLVGRWRALEQGDRHDPSTPR